jgi:hypothetical protein
MSDESIKQDPSYNLLETLKLATTTSDLLSDEERETHDLVLNTFEKIASNNMFGSMKAVIDTVADELNMQPSDIAKILDAHYTEEENKDALDS